MVCARGEGKQRASECKEKAGNWWTDRHPWGLGFCFAFTEDLVGVRQINSITLYQYIFTLFTKLEHCVTVSVSPRNLEKKNSKLVLVTYQFEQVSLFNFSSSGAHCEGLLSPWINSLRRFSLEHP